MHQILRGCAIENDYLTLARRLDRELMKKNHLVDFIIPAAYRVKVKKKAKILTHTWILQEN